MEKKPQDTRDAGDDDEDEELEDVEGAEVRSYVILYSNGSTRQVWSDETPDEVGQRWRTELGHGTSRPRIMRFPSKEGKSLTRFEALRACPNCKQESLAAFCQQCNGKPTVEKLIPGETGDLEPEELIEVELPIAHARVDLIVDIVSVPLELADDDEDEDPEGEDETPEEQAIAPPPAAPEPAPAPGGKSRKAKLPAGFTI